MVEEEEKCPAMYSKVAHCYCRASLGDDCCWCDKGLPNCESDNNDEEEE